MSARSPLPDPPLMIVTDRRQARLPLESVAAAAFEAGTRWISVREKDLPLAEQIDLVRRLARIAPAGARIGLHGIPMPEVDGVAAWHLPRDGDLGAARRQAPGAGLIGQSCHGLAAVEAALAAGADYVTLSPIFATRSKPGYGPALGTCNALETATAAQNYARPAAASSRLGGVTAENDRPVPHRRGGRRGGHGRGHGRRRPRCGGRRPDRRMGKRGAE